MATAVVSVRSVSQAEGTSGSDPNHLQFEVRLSEAAQASVSMNWFINRGTADQGDLSGGSFPAGLLSIAAGQTSGLISVRLNGDSAVEFDESVVLQLYNLSPSAVFEGQAQRLYAFGTVLDDDGGGEKRTLLVSGAELVEGNAGQQLASFKVQLSRPALTELRLDYHTVDGSALAGQDHGAANGVLVFAPGQTEATVTVPVHGDTLAEAEESFALLVVPQAASAASFATGGAAIGGTALIADDDSGGGTLPVVSVRGVNQVEATTGSDPNYLYFEVVLSQPATGNVSMSWFVNGGTADQGDISGGSLPAGTLTIAAGQTSGFVSVRLNGDSAVEPDQTLLLQLYNLSSGAVFERGAPRLYATGTILDDDGGGAEKRLLSVTGAERVEGDAGTQLATFRVQLSRPAVTELRLDYRTLDGSALAGQDYDPVAGVLVFAPGQTEAIVSVPVRGDAQAEVEEQFTLLVTPQPAWAGQLSSGSAGIGAIGLIGDDDTGGGTRPIVSVRGARQVEATSGSDPNYLQFEVVLSEPATTNVSMDWFTSGGTADQGDLSAGNFVGGTLTVLAGQTSGFISVRLNGGSGAEPDESLLLQLHNLSAGAVFERGAPRLQATGIILDDDGAGEKRALIVSGVDLVEGHDGVQLAAFKVQLSRPADAELRLDYRTVDGSALAGQDYFAVAGTLVFAPGQTEAVVLVPVQDDSQPETEERFTLLVTPQPAAAALLATGAGGVGATGIIRDGNAGMGVRPVVSVRDARQFEATTGSDPNYLNFEVLLSQPAASNVSMNWYVSGGAANQNDYSSGNYPGGTLTLLAGQTSGFISLRITGDSAVEADETLTLQLYNLSPGAGFEGNVPRLFAHGTILDDDGAGEKRSLLVSGAEVTEGAAGTRLAAFKVQLSRPADSQLRLDYRTVDGTAQAGQDYDATNGMLVFAPGQTEAYVWVPVRGDLQAEDEEHFTLLVTPIGTSALLATGDAGVGGLGLIGDDDSGSERQPVVSVRGVRQTEATTGSDPNYLHFEVVLSQPAPDNVSMNWYASGGTVNQGDLSAGNYPGGTLTLLAGQTSGFVSVRITGDSAVETDETLVLQLYNLSSSAVFERGAPRLYATGTILDDDGGAGEKRVLSVTGVELSEGDGSSQLVTFRVQLSRPATTELRLDYRTLDGSALAGQDYDAVTGLLVFAPGQTEAMVTVPVRGDTLPEAEEAFALLVTPQSASAALLATGATGISASGLIGDDDSGRGTQPTVSVRGVRQHEATTGSDPNYLEFEVVLSRPATSHVTMNWYTSSGTVNHNDLSAGNFPAGMLVIAPGQTSGFVSVRITGDSAVEADEAVVLQLYNLSAGAVFERDALRLQATGTILDDDGSGNKRALLVSGVEVLEGQAGTQLATFKVQLSRAATTELRLDYRTLDGSALAGDDYVATSGELVFAPGQTEAFVSVAVRGDTVAEAEELFTLLVTPQPAAAAQFAAGATGVGARGLIGDDDTGMGLQPVLSVRSVRQPEGTTGSDPNYLQFEVVLSRPVTSNVSLNWRTLAGSATVADLSSGNLPSGQLTLSAGQTSGFINVRITGDSLAEPDEYLRLELSNPNGAVFAGGAARLQATGVILDDDGSGQKQALAIGDVLVTEGNDGTTQAVFTLSLSRPTSEPLVLSYRTAGGTAQPGSDFQASTGTVVFAPGQTEASVSVTVFGDHQLEADETFGLQIDPTNQLANGAAGLQGAATIVSDDTQNPPVTVADSYTTLEGRAVSVPAATGVLANDSDPEGNPFVAQLVAQAAHGTVTLRDDGSFTYVPDAGFHGVDSFTYRAFDGIGASDATRVEIGVTALPDGPGPHPSGPPRIVNAFDPGDQITPSIAALSDGHFVVVWVSRGQDGDGDGVYGRIVDSQGDAVSAEFRINSTTVGDQQAPRVAALQGGGFVVVWDSFGQDGDKDAIVARRFGNDGLATGAEVLVNQTTASWQLAPDVTGTADGGYAVVWQSEGQDGSGSGVYGRRFGANDAALGAEFRLSQETRLDQSYPRIAALTDGRLAAVWESEGQDGDGDGVFARIFSAGGAPLAAEFQANQHFASYQSRPDITALATGGFAIAWSSYGQVSVRHGVHVRGFAADGTAVSGERSAVPSSPADQLGASVSGLDDGTFLVSFASTGQGQASVLLARFDAGSGALGEPVVTDKGQVTDLQWNPDVATSSAGSVLMVKDSVGSDADIESAALQVAMGTPLRAQARAAIAEGLFEAWTARLAQARVESPDAPLHPVGAAILEMTSQRQAAAAAEDPSALKEWIKTAISVGSRTFFTWTSEIIERAVDGLPAQSRIPALIISETFNQLAGVADNAMEQADYYRRGWATVSDELIGQGVGILAGLGAAALVGATAPVWVAVGAGVLAGLAADWALDGWDTPEAQAFIDNVFMTAITMTDEAIEAIPEVVDYARGVAERWNERVRAVAEQVAEDAARGIEYTKEQVEALAQRIAEAAQEAAQAAKDGLDNASEAIDRLIDDIIDKIPEKIDEAADALGEAADEVGDAIDAFKQHVGKFIEEAKKLFDGANRPIDPLVLDLDHDGLELVPLEQSNARFDMDADGFAERTAWVASDDAFLIQDRNGDGIVNDISEFFGSAGIDGFAELAGHDTSRDGRISADEPIWQHLQLWRDLNGNGNTDAGELMSLGAAGVTEISVRTQEVRYTIGGNLVPYISSFHDARGEGLAGDAFFRIDQFDSVFEGRSTFAEPFVLDIETLAMPFLRGYGNAPDLYIEMSIDPALKALVKQFMLLAPAEHAQAQSLAEQIIFTWARVENIAPDARGPFFDARKLAALEVFFGERFDVTTTSGRFISNNPTTAAMGDRLAQAWDLMFTGAVVNLIVQSRIGGDGVGYDVTRDEALLLVPMTDFVSSVAAQTPQDPIEAIQYWNLMGAVVNAVGGQSGLNASQLTVLLDEALDDVGLPFSFKALANAQIATGEQGATLTGTQDDDLFVASSADETFFGGQGGDVYFLREADFGDDSIVEVTANSDEGAPDVVVLPADVGRDDFTLARNGSGLVLTVPATGATLTVTHTSLAGADGDFGVEIIRLHDGTELLVADLLGVFSVEAGTNAVVAEGGVFQRDILINDPGEAPPAGWQYRLEWSDGLIQTGTVPASSARIPVTRTFADGAATYALSVQVTGAAGATDSDRVVVTVRNVEPVAVVTGAARVAEGAVHSLEVGAVVDPGPDTRTAYDIAWGDGSTQTFSPAAWAAANGRFTHVYADGAATRQIIVSATDEDGTHRLGGAGVEVVDIAPTIALSGEGAATAGQPYVLVLGAVTDPGADTASGVIVHWGDGTSSSHPATGTVVHQYASAGHRTIVVDVVDEEGTHEAAGAIDVTVSAQPGTLAFDAGEDAAVREGQAFSRTIQFSDESDGSSPGWTFAIDWDGDGVHDETGSTASRSLSLNHVFADGNARPLVTVRIQDGATEFATDSFRVDVANVAPTLALAGSGSAETGSPYTLNLASLTDPGQDSASSFIVHWGDGQQQVVTALGLVTHHYAGAGRLDVTVDVVDEDGVHAAAGRHVVNVTPAPAGVSLEAGVDTHLNEGGNFSRTIAIVDGRDDGAAGWRYDIDWNGDGTIDQSGTTLVPQVVLNRSFADGDSLHAVRVKVTDVAGDSASDAFGITVRNVAPQASLAGQATGMAGVAWTLNIGAIIDPGTDTVTRYTVRWGDGSSQTLSSAELASANRTLSHVYATAGRYNVSLDLVDEDGSFSGAGAFGVGIGAPPPLDLLRVGYAVQRLTSSAPNAWHDAWSAPGLSISHKADATQASEPWTAVNLLNGSPLALPGSDVYLGDLGVSGQAANTSAVRQELDGAEALRFTLPRAAVRASIDLTSLQTNDDALGFSEAGRMQAFDAAGVLVAERVFVASDAAGARRISIESDTAFASLVITAGAYNGGSFVPGAYASAGGGFGAAPFTSGGRLHGSEFLVDGLELAMPALVGVQAAGDPALSLTLMQMGD